MDDTSLIGSTQTQHQQQQSSLASDRLDFYTTMNNFGVILLRKKQYDEASNCFCEAIKQINYRIFAGSSKSYNITTNTTLQALYLLLDEHDQKVPMSSYILSSQKAQQGVFVFGNPVVLAEFEVRNFIENPISKEEYSRLSMVCLYNMALSYHLAGLEKHGECDTGQISSSRSPSIDASVDHLFGLALAYYEMAYRILVSEQDVLASQAMVILNNVGHIHRLSGDQEGAKKCFQYLLSTMVYLQETGNAGQIHHWEFFFSNVVELILPQPGPAPAA